MKIKNVCYKIIALLCFTLTGTAVQAMQFDPNLDRVKTDARGNEWTVSVQSRSYGEETINYLLFKKSGTEKWHTVGLTQNFIIHPTKDQVWINTAGNVAARGEVNFVGDRATIKWEKLDIDTANDLRIIEVDGEQHYAFTNTYDNKTYYSKTDDPTNPILTPLNAPVLGAAWILGWPNKIYFKEGITPENPKGTNIFTLIPDVKANDISVNIHGETWVAGKDGNVYRRNGVTPQNPKGESWTEITSPTFTHISVGKDDLVLAIETTVPWTNKDDVGETKLYYRDGITTNNPTGTTWVEFPDQTIKLRDTAITPSGNIWGRALNGQKLYIREGVSAQNKIGTSWREIELPQGVNSSFGLAAGGNTVVCIDGNGIYRRTGITAQNPGGTGWSKTAANTLRYISVGSNGDIWASNVGGMVYYIAADTLDNPKFEQISNLKKGKVQRGVGAQVAMYKLSVSGPQLTPKPGQRPITMAAAQSRQQTPATAVSLQLPPNQTAAIQLQGQDQTPAQQPDPASKPAQTPTDADQEPAQKQSQDQTPAQQPDPTSQPAQTPTDADQEPAQKQSQDQTLAQQPDPTSQPAQTPTDADQEPAQKQSQDQTLAQQSDPASQPAQTPTDADQEPAQKQSQDQTLAQQSDPASQPAQTPTDADQEPAQKQSQDQTPAQQPDLALQPAQTPALPIAISALDKEIENVKQEKADVEQELKNLATKHTTLEKKLVGLNALIAQRRGELKKLKADITAAEKRLTELTAKYEGDIAAKEAAITELQSDATATQAKLDSIAAQAAQLSRQEDLLALEKNRQILTQRLNAIDFANAQELEAARTELMAKLKELQDMKQTQENADEQQLIAINGQLQSFGTMLANVEQAIQTLEQKQDALKTEITPTQTAQTEATPQATEEATTLVETTQPTTLTPAQSTATETIPAITHAEESTKQAAPNTMPQTQPQTVTTQAVAAVQETATQNTTTTPEAFSFTDGTGLELGQEYDPTAIPTLAVMPEQSDFIIVEEYETDPVTGQTVVRKRLARRPERGRQATTTPTEAEQVIPQTTTGRARTSRRQAQPTQATRATRGRQTTQQATRREPTRQPSRRQTQQPTQRQQRSRTRS
ncbi:MAG: hypothetical protein H6679_00290 [Epsilonproteobacteria bacterium]|nr:hypothetical protein [Campylobacterota bacterium]